MKLEFLFGAINDNIVLKYKCGLHFVLSAY